MALVLVAGGAQLADLRWQHLQVLKGDNIHNI